jgi:2-haloacid dehalogenase
VDWRTSVVDELVAESHVSLNAATASLASALRVRVGEMTTEHWGMFASQWRESYQKFTRQLAENPTIPWKSVDDHHLDSLRELVTKCVDTEDLYDVCTDFAFRWQIEGLWDDEQLRKLSLAWHRLQAWPDSVSGVTLLNQLFCQSYPATFGPHANCLSDLHSLQR